MMAEGLDTETGKEEASESSEDNGDFDNDGGDSMNGYKDIDTNHNDRNDYCHDNDHDKSRR